MIRTGTDVVEISRFETMKNRDRFIKRVFTKREADYFAAKKNPAESIAGHYAAKEAFSKFLGTGIRGVAWTDIEVCHDGLGKPYLLFLGRKAPVDLSISHSRTVASAVVCGDDDGISGKVYESIKSYRGMMPRRGKDMNKGDCGRVLAVAGSKGMTGAACLTALGALRSGAGLVTVGIPESEQPVAAAKLTEAMTLPLSSEGGMLSPDCIGTLTERVKRSDVCIFGPGLGQGEGIGTILDAVLQCGTPVLIDADGINALAKHIHSLKKKCCEVVLTPHPGEMSRLTGLSIERIQAARVQTAADFAAEYGVTLLLKGSGTVIASPGGEVHVNETGNSGMATGGMGDVLSGVIGALIGQGKGPYEAAVLGAFIHGLAGDVAADRRGKLGMIAGDVVDALPRVFQLLEQ